ncbi:hypothetical protein L1987_31463 [Smallanthus sonchifolius]|uniref:Uncharacterized protein n=1 Tax=Smallanthus sonchifolius TaxID=185202 RepID=A0ACB9I6V3_9ASTR|nr:hypothetical protein L1987_31463 [Smallanthus sonchifolius]
MDELNKFKNEAANWLRNIPPEHWSRSCFSGMAHSDVLLNNMCEVLNAKLVDGRDKPIITTLDYIREYLMKRIVNVLKVIDRSEGLLTPYATKQFEAIKKEATKYTVIWNGEGGRSQAYHASMQWQQYGTWQAMVKNVGCQKAGSIKFTGWKLGRRFMSHPNRRRKTSGREAVQTVHSSWLLKFE